MTSTYKIIYESLKDKRESILKTECICPVCSKTNEINCEEHHPRKNMIRYRYTCPECGTVWDGNTYNENMDRVEIKQFAIPSIGTALKLLIGIATVIIAGSSPETYFAMIGIDILLLGIWLMTRLLEAEIGAKECVSKHIRDIAGISMAILFVYGAVIMFYVLIIHVIIPVLLL